MLSGIILRDCHKTYTHDLDKVVPPQETVARVLERLKAVDIDVFKETVRIDKGRLDIPVYASRCGMEAARLIGNPHQLGKGATPAQAEASALMELVERFSLFSFLRQPRTRLAYETIRDKAIPLETLALSLNDTSGDLDRLRPLLETLPMDWVWTRNLTRNKDQLMPLTWFFRIHETNGAAAGNTLEEAILQGVCEVVERHVASVIVHGRLPTPGIAPRTVRDPVAKGLLDKLRREGINLFLKDFTMEMGVPTVAALAWDPAGFPEKSEIVFTAGTATDPVKCVVRAITEIAQLAGDFLTKTNYRPTLPRYEKLEEAEYLLTAPEVISLSDLPNLYNDNILMELDAVVHALARQGLEVSVANLTHPRLEIPTVYVLVPGSHLQERARQDGILLHFSKLIAIGDNSSEAIDRLQEVRKLFPDRSAPLFFLGHALERAGNPSEALDIFEKALELEGEGIHRTSIYSHIGACLRDLGRLEQAVEVLQEATSCENAQKESFQLLGQCYFKLRDYYKAIEVFGGALRRDPNSGIDYANIGSCMRELGYIDQAIDLYEFALELSPALEEARKKLVVLKNTNRPEDS